MPSNAVALDSSALIEHVRIKNKDDSLLSRLISEFDELCISPLVLYEILIGQRESHFFDVTAILEELTVLPFDGEVVAKAVSLYRTLKRENKLIDHFDILIAATAIVRKIPLATLNRKHFERIDELKLFDDEKNNANS
jgi:predicted nucleic acid-binding protein